jgi:hypothetical protein
VGVLGQDHRGCWIQERDAVPRTCDVGLLETLFARDLVFFRTDDQSGDWALVWVFRLDTVLSAMVELGWPVDDY